jgi:predicted ABC-type ATPase
MRDDIPTLTVIAGPTAIGKSTFIGSQPLLGPAVSLAEDNRQGAVAGFAADPAAVARTVDQQIRTRASFALETALKGQDAFHVVERAAERGFRIDVVALGARDQATVIERGRAQAMLERRDFNPQAVAREFDRILKAPGGDLERLIRRADSAVLLDAGMAGRPAIAARFEQGAPTFSATLKAPWAVDLVNRGQALVERERVALVPPVRSPELRDSQGRGLDRASIERAALGEANVREGFRAAEAMARVAFVDPRPVMDKVWAEIGNPKLQDLARQVADEAKLRGSDRFLASSAQAGMRAAAVEAKSEFNGRIEQLKTAFDTARENYIVTVQQQRRADLVSVPQLSAEATRAIVAVNAAFSRSPAEGLAAYKAATETSGAANRVGRELAAFNEAVTARLGSAGVDNLVRGRLGPSAELSREAVTTMAAAAGATRLAENAAVSNTMQNTPRFSR